MTKVRNREFASFGLEVSQVQAKGNTLTGYASVFDYPIDSGVRGFPQTTFVRQGAFTRTLQQNKDNIQVLFNHGLDPRYGGLPIGVIRDIHQDKRGLWTEVELHNGPDNENIRAALASGALRAQSIQFEVMQEDFEEDNAIRNIREVKLYEFGPVTFPANEAATASLHSLDQLATRIEPQSDAPSDETRESTLDEARVTWDAKRASRLRVYEKSLEEIEDFLKKELK